jgi:hypothetical protein
VVTDVSEECIASIFTVEITESEEYRYQFASGLSPFLVFYPENEGDMFLRNVGSHNIYTAPQDGVLRSHSRENLKSYI